MTTLEGVLLPVGGIILEVIPSDRFPLGENPVHLLDKRQWRHWCRYLLGGVVGGDNGRLAGGLTGRLDEGGELKGGLPSSCSGDQIHVGARGSSHGCWFWLLPVAAVADIAWQLSVWCGTASKGGTCSTNIVGWLGL